METNILTQDFYNDQPAQQLVQYLRQNEQNLEITESTLYYNFPLFKNIDEEIYSPSVMLIDSAHGIVLFKCANLSHRELELDNFFGEIKAIDEDLSEVYNFVYSKLRKNKSLRRSRDELLIRISAASYLPYLGNENNNHFSDLDLENELLISDVSIFNFIRSAKRSEVGIPKILLNEAMAIIEGAKGIIKPKKRQIETDDLNSKGAILSYLEKEIATFDKYQKYAALTQLKGPQRIRGLAGSGKTIVLTMKAALIHQRYPDAKILYTFYTKSLYDYIKRLITRFYRDNEDTDPDWDKICIRHAWGGQSLAGVYYEVCKENGIQPLTLSEAKARSQQDPFDYICGDLLDRTNGSLNKVYDYVLIDEAQDFRASFYQLCRQIAKDDCIVWGYDELQNILDVKVQSTVETFKNERYRYDAIDLEHLREQHPDIDNDIVLPRCYRSPIEILVLAHAIGFGIYNSNIIQMLENKEHWEDLGYEILQGNCNEGDAMIIQRPEKNSPLGANIREKLTTLVNSHIAADFRSEVQWICESIESNISGEKLNPEDVLVICIDDQYARRYFNEISEELVRRGINSNNVLANTYSTNFFIEGCVTLSTVYRAKGNEAAMVYVIGTDTFAFLKDSRIVRNKLFTAFTRSKAWLTVTGVGNSTRVLVDEIETALSKMPNLEFTYPNIEKMNILQRDLASDIAKKKVIREKFQELILEAERKGISLDDLLKLGMTALDKKE